MGRTVIGRAAGMSDGKALMKAIIERPSGLTYLQPAGRRT
jgi:hypothetical protein